MAWGPTPTGIGDPTMVLVATSITDTLLEAGIVTYANVPPDAALALNRGDPAASGRRWHGRPA